MKYCFDLVVIQEHLNNFKAILGPKNDMEMLRRDDYKL